VRSEIENAIGTFVRQLEQLDGTHKPRLQRTKWEEAEGRRRFAEIRRGAAEPDAAELYVLRAIRVPEAAGRHLPTFVLIAVLYALHKQKYAKDRLPSFHEHRYTSLGRSLRQLRQKLRAGEESLDMRFQAVLNSRQEDLQYHLRSIIMRIASFKEDIPVDYKRLLLDLIRWSYMGHPVQRQWAREYWQREPFNASATR